MDQTTLRDKVEKSVSYIGADCRAILHAVEEITAGIDALPTPEGEIDFAKHIHFRDMKLPGLVDILDMAIRELFRIEEDLDAAVNESYKDERKEGMA